jgi:hypothetical protein
MGRIPGAPPLAEAVAAALRGLSLDLDGGGASAEALGVAAAETPFADVPESGFSSMRNKYW